MFWSLLRDAISEGIERNGAELRAFFFEDNRYNPAWHAGERFKFPAREAFIAYCRGATQ